MTDLADFLLARIAEDEHETRWLGPCDCHVEGFPLQHGLRCAERVIADCDAKRRIVEDLRDELANQHDPEPATLQLAERTLLALALPHADHEDYQPEWANVAGSGRTHQPQSAARRSPQCCPECGAGETEVHARSCKSKAGRPLSSGAVPYGGACDMPGCRYADRNVRHVHPAGDVNR